MSDVPNGRRGVHFDPTINLGHVLTATATLTSVIAAWVTLNTQVTQLAKDLSRVEQQSGVGTVRVETLLMQRIQDERARLDQTQVRTADDVREIKQLMRDGFRDLDVKLERKVEKPNR